MGRARRLAPGVVALGLALTACGGSSSTAALTTPAPPSAADTTTAGAPTNAALGGTFTRATALPPTVSCTYPPVGTAVKPNTAPPVREISTQDTVPVTVTTGAGDIGLTLDRTVAPCTVNSFVSLAEQTYFDGTRCHRLVTSGIYVLQCGDPTASGTGGPGYVFANEYPTDQYPTGDPRLSQPVNYPRGTIAMANTGKPTPTAASSSSCTKTHRCLRNTRYSAPSTALDWRSSKRSRQQATTDRRALPGVARRRTRSPSPRSPLRVSRHRAIH